MTAASGSIVIVMDADLQHPADVLPQLIDNVARGSDLVVASRRVQGGSEADGLNVARRLGSLAASSLAWALFPSRLRRVADPLSGFFALRLSQIDLDRLQPDGFKILVELLATHPDLSTTEIPYRFAGRNDGLSKASPSQATRFIGHLVDLRIRTSRAWAGAPVPQREFRSA
jgi:dolichol-phosphate mannosyltransferase